ncbi:MULTISPECIES: aquaporin Z [Leptolyngbya]|jgi:aquaporin Z|uniref:MIP family channel protein n=2 Tax=Leptolyngbya boryana TaxID=1184 RepID=A0A1Z4JKT0_LEPBY|nr:MULTISPECIES: aquaporin Z [Leptolyngbya]BAY57268.1 MIP family channel protein [Leptolyngbya boryana NIES-2135]MBD1857413.1 aquaporin Z [Leptolyngbya sp. FACHB-1624]MBD2366982.1 aquaporin Z [Leptolyngbya sp. FACHB-161]MBD2373664.1 aquaporin Z [Leptolyngbya sp. FACHB-238]MBD2398073.1 aquaporin Z [Leptolyngbya sp. FACHB-239]
MSLLKRCAAEFLGTLWLVFGGCGSAVLAAAYTADTAKIGENTTFPLGIGLVGVSLAFGLTVLTMAYAVGGISGGHFNPAVSFGLFAAKRFRGGQNLLAYIVAQVLGGIVGAGVLYLIASGKPGFALTGSNPLATNGFDAHSPGGYGLVACFLAEAFLTFFFLLIILGVTDRRVASGFAPVAIGFALTLIHLISIPVTNTSVNPARSLAPAVFVGGELLAQVWLFWVAPILGAVLAGWVYSSLFEDAHTSDEPERIEEMV